MDIPDYWGVRQKEKFTGSELEERYRGVKGNWTVVAQGSLTPSHNFVKEVKTVKKAMSVASKHFDKYPGHDDYADFIDDIIIVSPTKEVFGHQRIAANTNQWVKLENK